MARYKPTQLVRDLRRLKERIEATYGSNGNHRAARRRAYVELLGVLNGARRFENIPRDVPQTAGLTERIHHRLADNDDYALPRAVYETTRYAASIDGLIARGRVHGSEWEFLQDIARDVAVPIDHSLRSLAMPPDWMIDVDESHEHVRVWLRELALQDMLMAALESYLVPAGSGRPSTEVYGSVFGSFRQLAPKKNGIGQISRVEFNVERICIQHRARGTPSEVVVNERSEKTHLAMSEELFPYWHLLGDFHTHTYKSLGELVRRGGWCYSPTDEQMNVDWVERIRALGHRPRLALILAIAHAGRNGSPPQENWRGQPNVLRATIGRCHCFISAFRIRADGRYARQPIELKCPHLVGGQTALYNANSQ